MSTAAPSSPHPVRHQVDPEHASRLWGWAGVTSAALAAAGLACTWAYSVTEFDPVPWLRIPLILLLPLGLVATLLCAAIAWPGPGRRLAAVALAVSAVVVAAFITLLNVMT